MAVDTAEKVGRQKKDLRMSRQLFKMTSPSSWPYTKGISTFSIEVQLLAQSGQLDTMHSQWTQGIWQNNNGLCEYRCQELSTEHHIFVKCPCFRKFREEATQDLNQAIGQHLGESQQEECKQTIREMT